MKIMVGVELTDTHRRGIAKMSGLEGMAPEIMSAAWLDWAIRAALDLLEETDKATRNPEAAAGEGVVQ